MFIDPVNNRLYAPRSGQVMVFDNVSTKDGDVGTTAAPERIINLPLPAMTNITVELTANRLYALDGDGLSIIANASTVKRHAAGSHPGSRAERLDVQGRRGQPLRY